MGERVDIVVTETGSKQAASNIDAIGTAADKSAASVDKVNASNDALSRTAVAAKGPLDGLANAAGTAGKNLGALTPAANAAASSLDKTRQAASDTQQQTSDLSNAFTLLKGVLGGLALGSLVSEYVKLADTFTSIVSRLKLVSNNAKELVTTEQQLLEMSNRTRSSLEDNANLYLKLAQQAGSLGIEQKSLLPTIETVNQLIAISGVTATEAKAGLMQFSQGLASNRFQGDELRSVLENLPALGQAIAKGLGVTTAGLRDMGEKGQLSAKLILDAISKQAPEIQKQFASIVPTVGGALQVMKNNVLQLVGVWDQLMHSSGTLAQAILVVANNLGTIARAIAFATTVTAAFYAALTLQAGWNAFAAGVAAVNSRLQAYMLFTAAAGVETTVLSRAMAAFAGPIGAVTSAFRTLWAVMLANPITAILTLLAAAAAAVYFFGDSIKITSDGSISLWGAVMGTLTTLWNLLKEVGSWIATTFGPYWTALGQIAMAVLTTIGNGIKFIISLLALFIPSLDGVKQKMDSLGSTWVKNMKDATASSKEASLASADLGSGFRSAADGGNALAGSNSAVGSTAKLAGDGMTQLGRVVADSIPPFENLVRAQEKLNNMIEKGNAAFQKNHQEVEATRQSEKALENTTRDAMGHIVQYTDEADKQTGRLFDTITNGAADASAAYDQLANSAQAAMSAVNQPLTGSRTLESGDNTQHTNPMLEGGVSTDNGQTFHSAADDLANFKQTGRPIANPFTIGTPMPWNQLLEEAAGDTNLQAQIKAAAKARGIPGFRDGGSFNVGGTGGADSQLVQFMASPDEQVEVKTPAQQRATMAGGGNKTVIVNMSVKTPDANSFNRSKNQTLLQLRSRLNNV
jgi:tape measure domain-containing protein